MDEKPKRSGMSRSRLVITIIVAAVVLGGLITALVLAIVLPLVQPIVDAGDAFWEAAASGNVDAAYAMLTPELQGQVAQDDFNEYFTSFTPSDWSYSQRKLRNGVGYLVGTVSMNGEPYQFELEFDQIDDQWRIRMYNIRN